MFQTKQLFQTIELAVVSPKVFQIQAVVTCYMLPVLGWNKPERQVLDLSSQEILKIEKTHGQDFKMKNWIKDTKHS